MTITNNSKRLFLKRAPLAAIGAALGAKQIAENMAGVGTMAPKDTYIGGMAPQSGPADGRSILSWLLKNGLPDWKQREIRQRAYRVSHFDADIASIKSWSLTAKLSAQRQRNYDRIVAQEYEYRRWNVFSNDHKDQHGFWL